MPSQALPPDLECPAEKILGLLAIRLTSLGLGKVAKEPPELIQVLGGLGMVLPESVRQHADRLLLPLDPLRHVIRMTPGLIDFVEQPQPVAILPQPIPAQLAQAFRPLERQPRIDRLPSVSRLPPAPGSRAPAQSLERTGHVVVCRVETRRELESPGHVLMLCTEEPPLEHKHTVRRVHRPCQLPRLAQPQRSPGRRDSTARVAPGSDLPRRFARVSLRFAPADSRRPAVPRSARCEVGPGNGRWLRPCWASVVRFPSTSNGDDAAVAS